MGRILAERPPTPRRPPTLHQPKTAHVLEGQAPDTEEPRNTYRLRPGGTSVSFSRGLEARVWEQKETRSAQKHGAPPTLEPEEFVVALASEARYEWSRVRSLPPTFENSGTTKGLTLSHAATLRPPPSAARMDVSGKRRARPPDRGVPVFLTDLNARRRHALGRGTRSAGEEKR